MKTLIIIPAYNEAENIEAVIRNITKCAPDMDYVIINDCSKDKTADICREKGFNYVSLPINLGIGGGVQTGYLYALNNGYDIAIQMDGDGQHDPRYLKDAIKPIVDGQADVVIGSRFITNEGFQTSGMRRLGINLLSKLIKVCSGAKVKDVTSGFRAVNRKMIELFAEDYAQDYPEPEAIVSAAMHKARIKEVPVIMHERATGESSITAWKPIYYMFKVSLAILLYRLTFNKKRRIKWQ